MGRRNQPDGKLAKLIAKLKELIDEGTNFAEIVLKHRALSSHITKSSTGETLIGKEYWKQLQALLARPEAKAVLSHPPRAPQGQAGTLAGT